MVKLAKVIIPLIKLRLGINETADGQLALSNDEKRAINLSTGSSFKPPQCNIVKAKHTCGPMHVGAGCTTHAVKTMHVTVREKEEKMPFWQSVVAAANEAPRFLKEMKESPAYKRLHKESKSYGTKAKRLRTQADKMGRSEHPVENADQIISDIRKEAASLDQARLSHAKEDSDYGTFNLKIKGLETFVPLLEKHMKPESKKPRGPASWAFLKSIEYDAGGKFMAQHSGLEQTNGKGMTFLQNFNRVREKVVNMYAPNFSGPSPPTLRELAMFEWLKGLFARFQRVADTLFHILTFLKSQEKRDPHVFKELVYQFALAWEDAFPDKNAFNKLHFLLGHLPEFIELWEMIGVVNEESFEALHSRLARIKNLVKSMPSHSERVAVVNARMQTMLNENILGIDSIPEIQNHWQEDWNPVK